ncbi:hypothetical protein DYB26_008949 [Aphanomyces astaci]|uniref:Tc1-like transposase DDE domain-containing protein n=1 Tax=Aphanomyces astaci TaxID=112090 RepID=A0A3R7AIR4_APHAT|nr:hypothetical protein DYB26_008949 [Aphanomyces astaci]
MENPAPQTPPKRTYKRIPLSAKNRIVDAFNNAMDWMRVAQANGVNISSAGNGLHLDSLTPKQREFQAATLLRLAPYSPMFNPIENLWSEFKAHVKTLLRERLAAFTGPPSDGQNCEEFRMQYLEFVAQDVIDVVEVNRLGRFAFCLDYFYGRVEQLADMQVGL